MGETPRTDAAAFTIDLPVGKSAEIVHASMAREMERYLRASAHALRSYQYGNGSPDLAEGLAADIEAFLTADI